jgi:hypothetical protein
MAKMAGLKNIRMTAKPEYIESMSEWNDPLYKTVIAKLPKGRKLSEYVTSLYVSAIK